MVDIEAFREKAKIEAKRLLEAKIIKGRPSNYYDWKSYVGKWIEACLEDQGIPMFRTKYDADIKSVVVLGVCYGGMDRVGSVHFINVPEEDLIIIEDTTGEWRIFRKKYGVSGDTL